MAAPKRPFIAGCRPFRCSLTGRSRTDPRKPCGYKLSTDPFLFEKVRNIVGLYLSPPDKAMVLCIDEKTQIQALERTQPLLPTGLGYVEGVTLDVHLIVDSIKEPIARIEQFVAAYNKTQAPFSWTATADSILEKLQRLCSHIFWTAHESNARPASSASARPAIRCGSPTSATATPWKTKGGKALHPSTLLYTIFG